MSGQSISALMRAEITAVLVAQPHAQSTTQIAQQIVGRGQSKPRAGGYFAEDVYPYLRQLENAGEVIRIRRQDGSVCVFWKLVSRPDSAWAAAVEVTGAVDLDAPAGVIIGGEDPGADGRHVSSTSTENEEAVLRALLDARNRQTKTLKAQVAERDQTIAILHGEIARRARLDHPGSPRFVVQDLDR